jgi:hypothetical protein
MYNRRITRWGINKNYKAQEKEKILQQLAIQTKDVVQPETVTIHGRPVKMYRVERYLKKQRHFQGLAPNELYDFEITFSIKVQAD